MTQKRYNLGKNTYSNKQRKTEPIETNTEILRFWTQLSQYVIKKFSLRFKYIAEFGIVEKPFLIQLSKFFAQWNAFLPTLKITKFAA